MVNVNLSPASMRVVRLLVGNTPKSVSDLIREMKVTRTAVTEQLNELVAAGLVERHMQRLSGRGRPRHVYSATPGALLLLLSKNQEVVLPNIWRALREIGGAKLVGEVIRQVSRALAEHYLKQMSATTPSERVLQLIEILREEGVLVEIQDENSRYIIRQRSCPYIMMYEENRAACLLDQETFAQVLGGPVRQVACRHDGAPCCVFEVSKENNGHSPAS